MFFKMFLCDAMVIKLPYAIITRLLSVNVISRLPRALSAVRLVPGRVASQECCIKVWDLEMLINGKRSSTGLRIQTDSIAYMPFSFVRNSGALVVRHLTVCQEV